MLRKLLLTFLVIGLSASYALAQTGSITGQVTDAETGETVPTANVLLVENNRGAATDANGEYEINNVPVGTYTLRVTFVGYKTYTEQVQIQAGETLENDIQLQVEAVGLDEVVVTGYGTQTKREITGSISSVSSEDIEDVPVQNTAAILQGRASGVQVSTTSGTPGGGFSVNVRGIGSINAGSEPLYIVDGVQLSFSNQSETTDSSPLNAISPSNIESIEVLKDASAAAIYGAQAANGVVLITTKSGQSGETQVTASVERGIRENAMDTDYMNRDQFIDFWKRAYQNSYGLSEAGAEQAFRNTWLATAGYQNPNTIPFDSVANTNWQDLIYRQGATKKVNASVSGGNETTTFRLAGNFEDIAGSIKDSDYKAYNLSANIDHQISDKFQTRVKVNLQSSEQGGVCEDGFFINCPVSSATFLTPVERPRDAQGDYLPTRLFGLGANPAFFFNEVDRVANTVQIIGNIQATYNFTDWLSLKTQFGMDYRSIRDYRYDSPLAASGVGGSINESVAQTSNFTTNTTLNFAQTFAEFHNVSGFVGLEYRRDYTREIDVTGQGYPNDLFRVLNASANPTLASGFNDEFRTAGYLGNLKYNYDQKYFVNFTARYDGSSRFGSNQRWGFFPSASVAWAISEEDFFNAGFIEDLKIRAGYGETGNSLIGLYAARGLYGTADSYAGTTGLTPTQLPNPNLTWETAKEINLGLDFSMFNNRFSGSINAYRKQNDGLLLNSPLPLDSSFGSITRNVGTVRNKGIEFDFNSVNLQAGDFQWSSSFNIAVQTNEVVELTEGSEALDPGTITPIREGHSIRALNIIEWAGVNPADGRPMWYDSDGNITYTPTTDDRKFIGDGGEEDIVGGFGNTLQYKGLSLRVFFQYSFGAMVQPNQVWGFGMAQVAGSQTNGREVMATKSWRNPGDVVGIPKPINSFYYPNGLAGQTTAGYFTSSTNSFWDASYIRLKNATLRYSLPTSLTSKVGLSNVSVYVTGLNLVTWTSYPGFDPDVSGGFQTASYPPARQVNAGMKVQF